MVITPCQEEFHSCKLVPNDHRFIAGSVAESGDPDDAG